MKAIVAMAANRVIGAGNKIPWHLPEDLKFFKATTLGHPIVMGRKTYDSIGKPLPGRENMILSRTMPDAPDVMVFRSPKELLRLENSADLFVIGGAEIYNLLLPSCDELIITHVPRNVRGDTFFPEFESAFDQGKRVYETSEFTTIRYARLRA